jgi:ABC-type bacteriocin/lantibiotic exporter with double-glycine peptidase domain
MKKPPAFPLLKLEMQRGEDCGLACIASITGYRYEDVLSEASRKRPVGCFPHETGLYLSEIVRIAKQLGCTLKKKRVCNFDKDEGILSVDWKSGSRFNHHVVVVVQGLIFDLSDMSVWMPSDYQKSHRAKFGSVLIPV